MTITTIKQRGDDAAVWTAANPTLALREVGWETDTGLHKLGDGATAWNALPYSQATPLDASVTTAKLAPGSVTAASVAADVATQVELDAEAAARAAAISGLSDTYVQLVGDTLTGPLVLPGNAASPLAAVPRQQLDAEALLRLAGDNVFSKNTASPDLPLGSGRTIPSGTFDLSLAETFVPLTDLSLNTYVDPDGIAGADGSQLATLTPSLGAAFTQADSALRPLIARDAIGVHDAVHFRGTDYMQQASAAAGTQPQSLATVFKLESLGPGSFRVLVDGAATASRIQFGKDSTTGQWYAVSKNGVPFLLSGIVADSEWHLGIFRSNGVTSKLTIDETTVTGDASTGAASHLTIGAPFSFSSAQRWNGKLGWLAWAKAGVWSDAQVTKIQRFAKDRWPTLALPSADLTDDYLPSGFVRLGTVILHYTSRTPTTLVGCEAYVGAGTVVSTGTLVEQVVRDRKEGAMTASQVSTRPITAPPLVGTHVESQIAELAAQYVTPTFGGPTFTRATLPEPAAAGIIARVTDDQRGLWISTTDDWLPIDMGFRPEWWGAKGDDADGDKTVTTAAFNSALAEAAAAGGGVVLARPSQRYKIDGEVGVQLNAANLMLVVPPGARLKAALNADNTYDVVRFGVGADNCWLTGGGEIMGDLQEHVEGGGVDSGHCVRDQGAKNVHIVNMKLSWSWGDGIYVGEDPGTGTRPKGLWVSRVHLYETRREAIGHFNCERAFYTDILCTDIGQYAETTGQLSGTTLTAFDCEPNNDDGEAVLGLSINGMKVYNARGRALNIAGGGGAVIKGVTVHDLLAYQCGLGPNYLAALEGHGVNLAFVEDIKLSGIHTEGCGSGGMKLRATVAGSLDGFTNDLNGGPGIWADPGVFAGADFVISNGRNTRNAHEGMRLHAAASHLEVHNVINRGNATAGLHPEVQLSSGGGRVSLHGGSVERGAGSATHLVEVVAGSYEPVVEGVTMRGTGTAGKVKDRGAYSAFRNNRGFLTDAAGSASIASGATSVVVTHGLGLTPRIEEIDLQPLSALVAAKTCWPSAVNATTFTINLDVDPTATVTIGWKVAHRSQDPAIKVYPFYSQMSSDDLASYPLLAPPVVTATSDLLIMVVESNRTAGPAAPTVTGWGVTWANIGSQLGGSGVSRLTFYRAMGTVGTLTAGAIDFGGVVQLRCSVYVFRIEGAKGTGINGADATLNLTFSTSNATTSSVTLPAFTSSRNATLGVFRHAAAESTTPGAGFFPLFDFGSANPGTQLASQWSGENKTTVAASWPTSGQNIAGALELIAA